jgi:8-oxo-dGTP pyrophosphatase MutT (NUDIX family)
VTNSGEADRRRGAVLIPIFANAPHNVIFVERARHLRRNPGQIGFPGGLADPIDGDDPVKTALREVAEELGVDAERVSIVGTLPALEQSSTRLVITPLVAILDPATRFSLDGDEIAAVLAVPLAAALAGDYHGHPIWGFTARILRSFVDEWNAPQSSLRRAAETHWRE